ncbi:MAG: hypothetical protein GWP08_14375 [Nitrospiraceae bacterium]|nr:hypothetical protein [Nitrospiraceae bacterium]
MLALLLCSAFAALAQEAGPAGAPGQPEGGGAAGPAEQAKPDAASPLPEASPDAVEAPPQQGDVITLRSGRQIKNVQVLRAKAGVYEIQVTEDVKLILPRRQVVKIDYDDIQPNARGNRKTAPADTGGSLLQGTKLDPRLAAKLTGPIPGTPVEFEDKDLLSILAWLSETAGVEIAVDDSVKAIPPEQRRWDVVAEPGATLGSMLRDKLLKQFPNLTLVYQSDKLLVALKPSTEAPAPAPAPVAVPVTPSAPAPAPTPPADETR